MLAALAAFLANNYLMLAMGWPGLSFEARPLALWGGCAAVAIVYVLATRQQALRADASRIDAFNRFLIRACFWGVLLVGLADAAISFLRVEDLLPGLVGQDLTTQLGRSQWRGPNVHVPLLFAGAVLALFTRTLGFQWLALLIVIAELAIVLTRFVFSYEQAFMGDLVRFWYAALFLFASAYTLVEEGHVRVDVLYAGFGLRTRGFVNAVGTLVLGMSVCWVILIIGMGGPASIINSPMMNFEVSQSGFGMYTKYLMAGFLGVFAITMLVQFVSYLFEAVADFRREAGHKEHAEVIH